MFQWQSKICNHVRYMLYHHDVSLLILTLKSPLDMSLSRFHSLTCSHKFLLFHGWAEFKLRGKSLLDPFTSDHSQHLQFLKHFSGQRSWKQNAVGRRTSQVIVEQWLCFRLNAKIHIYRAESVLRSQSSRDSSHRLITLHSHPVK